MPWAVRVRLPAHGDGGACFGDLQPGGVVRVPEGAHHRPTTLVILVGDDLQATAPFLRTRFSPLRETRRDPT